MADDLDRFLAALRTQESGGNYQAYNPSGASGAYQFLDSTWANYKGYRRAMDAPPAIQDERARQLAQSYYDQFGSWDAVAKAWYAGPGFAKKNLDAPQGSYPSINAYAASVVGKMGGVATGSVRTVTAATNATATQQTPLPGIDPKLPIEDQITSLAYSQHGAVLAPFINDAEVRAILRRYVNREIDEATMVGLVSQTAIYQRTSKVNRQFDDLEASDPATAAYAVAQERDRISRLAEVSGYQMAPADLDFLARRSKRDGLTDDQIKQAIVGHFVMTGGGDAGKSYEVINRLTAQYMTPMSEATRQQWVTDMVMGRLDETTLSAHLRNVASSLYPTMAAALASNPTLTPDAYVDPYRQVAAKVLGINPNDVDFMASKWGKALQVPDQATGQMRSMTLDEWTKTIKTDRQYGWYATDDAMQQGASLVLNIGKTLGKVA